MTNVDVVVVCVTFHSATIFPQFASALTAGLGTLSVGVVVVDSGSRDATCEVVGRTLPEALLIALECNVGFAAGINIGLKQLRTYFTPKAILIANPDVRLDSGALEALFAGLSDPGTGITAPRLLDEDGRLQWSLRRFPSVLSTWCEAVFGGILAARLGLPSETIVEQDVYNRRTQADWATGGLLLMSEAAMATVGCWNETFFMYEEEVDYCLRARELGFLLRFVPEAHATRSTAGDSLAPWILAIQQVNRVRHMGQRFGRTRAEITRMALLTGDIARAFSRGRRSASLAAIRSLACGYDAQQVMDRFMPTANATVLC